MSLCKQFSFFMSKELEVSMMEELKYLFGLQMKQNNERIFINQTKYAKDLLKRFGIDNSKTKKASMSTTIKLDKDEKNKEVDIKMYQGIIGSLLYLNVIDTKNCTFNKDKIISFSLIVSINAFIISKLF